jgi:nucleotide-binding universal stress UspA family protein
MYRNILLAYDGSPDGCEALDQVAALASMSGATVRLLAVIEPPVAMLLMEGVSIAPENDLRNVQQILGEGEEWLARAGCAATSEIKRGDPAEQIILSARENHADLIVLGHRDQGTIARWLNGSVGSSVLHSPPCSVLVAVKATRAKDGQKPARKLQLVREGA